MTPDKFPQLTAPPGSCDTHMHFYNDFYPTAPTAFMTPPNALVEDYRTVQKRLQLERAGSLEMDAKGIRIADKICNARDVGFAPATGWSIDRRREYLDWTEQVVSRCKGALPALDDRYAAVLEEARAQLDAEQRRDQP